MRGATCLCSCAGSREVRRDPRAWCCAGADTTGGTRSASHARHSRYGHARVRCVRGRSAGPRPPRAAHSLPGPARSRARRRLARLAAVTAASAADIVRLPRQVGHARHVRQPPLRPHGGARHLRLPPRRPPGRRRHGLPSAPSPPPAPSRLPASSLS